MAFSHDPVTAQISPDDVLEKANNIKSKGAGPLLTEEDIENFLRANLPECLDGKQDNFLQIMEYIKACSDSSSEAFVNLREKVIQSIIRDFATPDAQDNAPSQRIDAAVCSALSDLPAVSVGTIKKGMLVVSFADTPVTDGNILINTAANSTLKIKFEISDTARIKIPFQLVIKIESSRSTVHYPKSGYDTLVYNRAKQITLDSIPQGKYSIVCTAGKKEYKTAFIIRNKKMEVTSEQLKKIFPETDDVRIEEVTRVINAASQEFNIGTPERMAHFIGQIGAETGGLLKLTESYLYSPRAVVKNFAHPQYGHLFENAVFDSTAYQYTYNAINYDENNCSGKELSRGSTICPYKNSDDMRNAYGATRTDTLEVLLNNKKSNVLIYRKRSDITKYNIEQLVKDGTYNSGLLRVKSGYIRSASLFDVTYACRMGNGSVSSKDGSTFLGKGFIHITGKAGYKAVSTEWNKLYPNDKKEFHGKDITLLETDVEVAIKASMVYWKIKNLNTIADDGMDDKNINDVGEKVNGTNPPNGAYERRQYTISAYKSIK